MSKLVDSMKDLHVTAIFTEQSVGDRLARRIAEEVGAKIINGLYTGSLSDISGDAGRYVDMMRYNVLKIVEALK